MTLETCTSRLASIKCLLTLLLLLGCAFPDFHSSALAQATSEAQQGGDRANPTQQDSPVPATPDDSWKTIAAIDSKILTYVTVIMALAALLPIIFAFFSYTQFRYADRRYSEFEEKAERRYGSLELKVEDQLKNSDGQISSRFREFEGKIDERIEVRAGPLLQKLSSRLEEEFVRSLSDHVSDKARELFEVAQKGLITADVAVYSYMTNEIKKDDSEPITAPDLRRMYEFQKSAGQLVAGVRNDRHDAILYLLSIEQEFGQSTASALLRLMVELKSEKFSSDRDLHLIWLDFVEKLEGRCELTRDTIDLEEQDHAAKQSD